VLFLHTQPINASLRNIRHHILVITVHEQKLAEELRKQISELYKKNMEAKNGFQLISPVVQSLINNYYTFFIAPDGSKEGYDLSDDGDRVRAKVVALLDTYKTTDGTFPVSYVELFYGDDTLPAKILNQN
jgi:hypothetical protein